MSKRKPTMLKLAAGNPGKRPLNRSEPIPSTDEPVKPDWLPASASEAWDAITATLRDMRILSATDAISITTLAIAYGELQDAVETLAREGHYITAENGRKYRHPATGVAADASGVIRAVGSSFGLNPSARAGLVVPKGKDALDEFKRFLANR